MSSTFKSESISPTPLPGNTRLILVDPPSSKIQVPPYILLIDSPRIAAAVC